ncbi:MAG: hypothetical protein EXQ91_09350 [Alphaproteobacteria bacterium]|nr:hypothetical protein [Alphaproteobacteria bacterium]
MGNVAENRLYAPYLEAAWGFKNHWYPALSSHELADGAHRLKFSARERADRVQGRAGRHGRGRCPRHRSDLPQDRLFDHRYLYPHACRGRSISAAREGRSKRPSESRRRASHAARRHSSQG